MPKQIRIVLAFSKYTYQLSIITRRVPELDDKFTSFASFALYCDACVRYLVPK